jgi:GntR family transcriptional regulator
VPRNVEFQKVWGMNMSTNGWHPAGPLVGGVVPKYRQLLQMLRNSMHSGELTSGARLPTAEDLSRTFGVSRGTVMKALAQLEAEGLVHIVQGVGSFVETASTNTIPFRFIDERNGERPGPQRPTYKVLAQQVIPAPLAVAERLMVEPNTPVIHLERLRLVQGRIVAHTLRYLPESLAPAVATSDLSRRPIHELLVQLSDLPLLRAEFKVESHNANSEEAHLLQAAAGTPIVAVERLTFTAPNRPAVWYRGLFTDTYWLGVRPDLGST